MRVLQISPRFGSNTGGDGLYAYNLTGGLVRHGIDVEVLTVSGSHFIHMKDFHPLSSDANDFVGFTQQISSMDGGIFELNFYSNAAQKAVEFALEERKPDVVHIHGFHQYFTFSAMRVLKRYRVPTIFSVHDYKIVCGNAGFFSQRTNELCLKCLPGKVLPPIAEKCRERSYVKSAGTSIQMALWKYGSGLSVVDYFHVGSRFVFELLASNKQINRRLVEIRLPHLGKGNVGIRGEKVVSNIVFIGRMVAHKGVTVFAKAVQGIGKVRIDIFGDGPELGEAKAILSGEENVTFHGWKSHGEMEEYLGLGTIVVVPYIAHETFCYVVLEAMMRGCCVVASRRGAIPELVDNGRNGLLVDQVTDGAFKKIITQLLLEEYRIFELGHNASKIGDTLDDISLHAGKMIELYQRASKPNLDRL